MSDVQRVDSTWLKEKKNQQVLHFLKAGWFCLFNSKLDIVLKCCRLCESVDKTHVNKYFHFKEKEIFFSCQTGKNQLPGKAEWVKLCMVLCRNRIEEKGRYCTFLIFLCLFRISHNFALSVDVIDL